MSDFVVKENKKIGEKYYYKKHSSGLDIYLFPKDFSTTFAIFGTNYGSIDRTFKTPADESFVTVPDGIAHFLEHKLFENEDGEDTFARYARYGGSANAFTSFEKTAYLFSCTDNFRENLEILLEFVTAPYFTADTVAKEQGIIGQEIKMYEDNPAWRVYFNLLDGLYVNHPIKVDIAGTAESIAQITPEILYRCYNTFYNLNNMALCICGNVTMNQVIAAADKILKPAAAVSVERVNPVEPERVNKQEVVQQLDVAIPLFNIGIKTRPESTPVEKMKADAENSILLQLLFGRTSEFYSCNYESSLINSSFGADYEQSRDYAFIGITGSSERPREVLEQIKAEIEKRKCEFFSEAEFEREKKAQYAASLYSFDSTEDIASTALSFILEGEDILDAQDILSEVTFEDIKSRFASSYRTDMMSISIIEPHL